jgi:uroporphyrinogen decarboxylase
MNKIERVRAALRSEPVDQIPVSFWFHFPPEQRAGRAMAQAHLGYYRAASPDFLKVMDDNGYAPLGVEAVRTPADWRKLRPAPLSSGPYQGQLDGLRRIADAIGDEVLLVTTIFSPYATGRHISNELVIEHIKTDPEAVSAGLATIAESLAEYAQACIRAGAAGIYFSAQGGERDRFTDEEFERYIKPHDLTVLRAAEQTKAEFNLLHICGANLRMEAYASYPAHAVNWAPQLGNLSLADGRALFGRPIVGGIDQRGPIVNGTPEQIVAEVQAAIREAGPLGFMIGAGCTVPSDIPIENLVIARKAAAR